MSELAFYLTFSSTSHVPHAPCTMLGAGDAKMSKMGLVSALL